MKRIRLFVSLITLLALTACVSFPLFNRSESTLQVQEVLTEEPVETEINLTEVDTPLVETATQTSDGFGVIARKHLEVLAGEIGDRLSGTRNEANAANYIKQVFEELGYTPQTQTFTGYDDYEEASFNSSNIVAVKQGLSDQQIVIGAHFDSVDDGGSKGADDNASGVAVMLETAELVINEETPYTIVFVAFGGEEEGLWGSDYFVDQLNKSERNNIIGMVNLDSLIAGDKVYVYGNEGPGSLRDWLLEDARQNGIKLEGKTDEDMFYEDGSPCECSDFDAFEKSNIPYAYFEATDWDLSADGMIQVDPKYGEDGEIRHTEYDTLGYIEKTFPGRIDDHLKVFSKLLYDLVILY